MDLLDALAPTEARPTGDGKQHATRAHDDYSTTPHYAELVRAAFGGVIACDPASSDRDNETIKATVYYTPTQNGLTKRWRSPVYLNPPSICRLEFLEHATIAAEAGCEMVVCLNLKHLCARYTQGLLPYVAAVHMPQGRPAFLHPTTRERSESPTDGRAFLYVGPNPRRFVDVFRVDRGWTFICIDQPHAAPQSAQAVIR